MVGASAALGLVIHAIAPRAGALSTGPALAPLVAGLLGIAIGASIGYGKPKWRIAAAGAACVPLFAMTPSWPMLAGIAALIALAIVPAGRSESGPLHLRAYGLRGMRGALAMMLGAAVTLLAMWAALRIGYAKQTMTWSGWTRDITASAAMGMIGILAMLPRHLRVSLDPVQAAVRRLPTDLDAEVRELCNRSLAIWNNAKDQLADGDPGKQLVRDGVMKTLEVAAKCSEVKAAGASDAELAKRMEDLDQRIAAASDAEVKAQYQSARGALDDQRRYRDHIKQNRERLIARMHNHVTTLEKFQLAASGLVAARAATSGATAVKQLEELSNDVAASGEALAEIEIGSAPDRAIANTIVEVKAAEA